MLNGDIELLERLFTNLLGNAIKFTPDDGNIKVAIKETEDSVISCVEDTGEGIPAEYTTKVFEKFEQVKGQKTGGTGLGLTISRYIVQAHLGRIWAESEPGRGARFYFSIPKNLYINKKEEVAVKKA
ncbi:MAG: ATP-binding protein [bacterium]